MSTAADAGEETTATATATATNTTTVIEPWSSQVEKVAAENLARNREMLECQEQIRKWKKRWNSAKQQHKQAAMIASLRADSRRWNSLTKRSKWEKANVLTVLQHHGQNLPSPLQENNFKNAAPAAVQNDKEIFLARIETDHCKSTYCLLNHYVRNAIASHLGSTSNSSSARRPVPQFFVPDTLKQDPQVVHRLLELYADYFAWQVMKGGDGDNDESTFILPPSTIWNDADLFVTFLRSLKPGNACLFASKDDLQRQVVSRFSLLIRNNPALVLRVLDSMCGCSYANTLELILNSCRPTKQEEEEHGPLSTAAHSNLLKNNKEFAMQVARRSDCWHDSTLKCFSQRLRNDDEFVMAVVSHKGFSLRYASYRLRKWNAGVVTAAFDNDPRALIHAIAGSPIRKKIERDRKSVLRFFERLQKARQVKGLISAIANTPDDMRGSDPIATLNRRVWKKLPNSLKRSFAIAQAALLSGCVATSELPDPLRKSRDFWMSSVKASPYTFFALPDGYKADVEFARAIPSYPNMDLFLYVRSFPELADNRDIWLKVVSSDCSWIDVVMDAAPPTILNDKEIMLKACSKNAEVYELLDFPLNEDREILKVALKISTDVLYDMPDWCQAQHPDLVADAIRQFEGDVWELFDYVQEDLWSNVEVARAWASQGGDYLHEEFADEFEDDKELFLEIAEHNPQDFWCASEKLCNDKDFMLQVVRKNPTLIREASRLLGQDFEVALMAFGGGGDAKDAKVAVLSRDLAGAFDINDRDDFQFITGFAANVRELIEAHENFVKVVLCGMSATKTDKQCPFQSLDQGMETSLAYRKLLAKHMGIPIGRDLRRLRRASVNLAAWGY